MRSLALAGIFAAAVARVLHARRVLADALNFDGDPDGRCTSSWCWLDHSDSGLCDAELITPLRGRIATCGLPDTHDGHHHDRDADVRWSRNFGAAA